MMSEMADQVAQTPGFIAALDQSGGSTPGALRQYGIPDDAYHGDEEMYRLMHEMRVRIMTSPAFRGDKVIAAILFEKTMDGEALGQPVPTYLWKERGIVPFLKVDKGLEAEADGVQLMKPIDSLDGLLERAVGLEVFGTKMRSVIRLASPTGIAAIVAQQMDVASRIAAHGLVPILEPEVLVKSPQKADAEGLLAEALLDALEADQQNYPLMVKITPPEQTDLYAPLMAHSRIQRVVALSGGYSREDACRRVSLNAGLIASFSRALVGDLKHSMSDTEFDTALSEAVEEIYDASTHRL